MIKKITLRILFIFLTGMAMCNYGFAQNSILVNFGTNSCSGSSSPAFSLIKNPFSLAPYALTDCDVSAQVPDIFAVFIAYNPKNNKIYLADIRSGVNTKIWVLDMGLPANIACPPVISTTPDYSYSYISNNFEFDNNGDLWSFSNYNDTTGQCNMDKFDVNTGIIINTRKVQFPAGNFPTSITSGDLTILPNGRMFATLGSFPSRLYEINNYSSTTTNATAAFLDTLPQSCYGIAYLNGLLELTGTDFSGNCYYYKYNITSNALDTAKSFQNGQLPIDNTSITPSVGVTKQLVNTVKINGNTADLTYEVYVRNLGNVSLNNINVSDNLAAVFGPENVSNISLGFVPGDNAGNLTLNPTYNGNNDSNLLAANQNLPNQTSVNTDYFVKLRLAFRVTNLNPAKIYLNSAVGNASIGNIGNASYVSVSDSSNNGPQSAVDPNNNGNAGDPGENVPTPFNFSTLPVRFISIAASFVDKTTSIIKWTVATPTINSDKFEIEYSVDGVNWSIIGALPITNTNQQDYNYLQTNVPPQDAYYRIKETDIDGAYIYSSVVALRNENSGNNFTLFPNPANNSITINLRANGTGKTQLFIFDDAGRQLFQTNLVEATTNINTSSLSNGVYFIKIINNGNISLQKALILHK
jgi:Secretion system C-terminal sorting domain